MAAHNRKLSSRDEYYATILRDRAYRLQGGLCHWCREPMTKADPNDPRYVSAEHVIPIHAGGRTVPGNVVAACRECNNTRHPELNRIGGSVVVASSGNDGPSSAFALLEQMRAALGGAANNSE